jgi:hypothetical protein
MKRTTSFHHFAATPMTPGPQVTQHEDDILIEVPVKLIPSLLVTLAEKLNAGDESPVHIRFYAGKLMVGRKRAAYTSPTNP